MEPIMRTQTPLNGLGLGLGSQLTCNVGLVFPTKGSSSPKSPMTPLSSNEHPYSSFCATPPLVLLALSLSLFSLQSCQPPLFTQFCYI